MTTILDTPTTNKSNDFSKTTRKRLPLAEGSIRLDGGTQSRVALHQVTVDDYAEAIRSGSMLPPIIVFDDGTDMWLADGYHRYHAHRAAEATEVDCEVHDGTQRDAILYSLHANATHGLRRTNEDKRKAVRTLLEDLEWVNWSDREIAKACGVSHEFVRLQRAAICQPLTDSETLAKRTVTRNGKTYEQTTRNIGRSQKVGASHSLSKTAVAISPQPFAANEDISTSLTTTQDVALPNTSTKGKIHQLHETNEASNARVIELEEDLRRSESVHASLRAEMARMAGMVKDLKDENEAMRKVINSDDRLATVLEQRQDAQDAAHQLQTQVDHLMDEMDKMARRYKDMQQRADRSEREPDALRNQTAFAG